MIFVDPSGLEQITQEAAIRKTKEEEKVVPPKPVQPSNASVLSAGLGIEEAIALNQELLVARGGENGDDKCKAAIAKQLMEKVSVILDDPSLDPSLKEIIKSSDFNPLNLKNLYKLRKEFQAHYLSRWNEEAKKYGLSMIASGVFIWTSGYAVPKIIRAIDARIAAKSMVVDDAAGGMKNRISELQNAIPEGARGRITMAVAEVEDAAGNRFTLVGTSEPRGYLRPGVTLKPGEIMVSGTGHAEADIINYANANNLKVVNIGATRPVCPSCVGTIGTTNGAIVTPKKQ